MQSVRKSKGKKRKEDKGKGIKNKGDGISGVRKGQRKRQRNGMKIDKDEQEYESSESEDFVIFDSGDSDIDMPHGGNPTDDDAECLFCGDKFSMDCREELWIQCAMCGLWAHAECTDNEREIYICDFCR